MDPYTVDLGPLLKGKAGLPNLAKDKAIRDETLKWVRTAFTPLKTRGDVEALWDDADKMFRCKPFTKRYESRADTATAFYAVAIHQLKALTLKAILDHLNDYRFVAAGPYGEDDKEARELEATFITELFHIAMRRPETLEAMSKAAHQYWKDGNCVVGVPWIEKNWDLSTWNGSKFEAALEYVGPVLKTINLKLLRLDPDIEDLDKQPAVFIEDEGGISWAEVLNNKDYVLPEGEDRTKEKMDQYLIDKSSELRSALADAQANADASSDPLLASSRRYAHWVGWVLLPIKYEKGKATWDEEAPTNRHRAHLLGEPDKAWLLSLEPNPFPLGIPMLAAHETEDDIGFYHQPRSQRIKTYYEQISIAQDQMIDNREKNCRRPIFYNPLDAPAMEEYDWGAGQMIPVTGDVSTATKELEIRDMTTTCLPHIEYSKREGREALHALPVVLGEALGGRTPATEYVGAQAAGSTPINEAIARFEQAIIVGFMKKFKAYVQTVMTPKQLVAVLGRSGLAIETYAADTLSRQYRIVAEGVANFATEQQRFQKMSQIYGLVWQNPLTNGPELLRALYASAQMDGDRFVNAPSQTQAYKAALIENQMMLQLGQWDEVEDSDNHQIHIDVVQRGIFEAKQSQTVPPANIAIAERHEALHKQKMNQAGQGVQPSGPSLFGPSATTAPGAPQLAGLERGQEISAEMGNVQGGSPIPAA